jgi:hypothetical protein
LSCITIELEGWMKSLVPDLVMTLITPRQRMANSAEKLLVFT